MRGKEMGMNGRAESGRGNRTNGNGERLFLDRSMTPKD